MISDRLKQLIEAYQLAVGQYYNHWQIMSDPSVSDEEAVASLGVVFRDLLAAEQALEAALPGTDAPPGANGIAYDGVIYARGRPGQVVAIHVIEEDDGTLAKLASEVAKPSA